MSNQIKSRTRVRKHGEVFTNASEVRAMCDLVNIEIERIDSRFLEPACGDGNFLAEILRRKLHIVSKKYKKSIIDYERQSLLALSSLYGIDILMDNVIICIDRLFKLWNKEYSKVAKEFVDDKTKKTALFILRRNIICGNALTLSLVDNEGNDLNEPIIFSEWAFITGSMLQRSDYTFANLLFQHSASSEDPGQISIFDLPECKDAFLLKKYVAHYKKVEDYAKQ